MRGRPKGKADSYESVSLWQTLGNCTFIISIKRRGDDYEENKLWYIHRVQCFCRYSKDWVSCMFSDGRHSRVCNAKASSSVINIISLKLKQNHIYMCIYVCVCVYIYIYIYIYIWGDYIYLNEHGRITRLLAVTVLWSQIW